MPYRVSIMDSANYTFDSARTAQEAEHLANKLFNSRNHEITVTWLSPCQVNGVCPFLNNPEHNCSDCERK